MPIEKFIPTSPDLDIRKDSDLAPAKLGHLNNIVDYINENNLANVSITGPLTTEAVVSNATLRITINGVQYKLLLRL